MAEEKTTKFGNWGSWLQGLVSAIILLIMLFAFKESTSNEILSLKKDVTSLDKDKVNKIDFIKDIQELKSDVREIKYLLENNKGKK